MNLYQFFRAFQFVALFALLALTTTVGTAEAETGRDARGGLVVVIDATGADSLLRSSIHRTGLVHGLVRERSDVETIRRELLESNASGATTVGHWDGERIPMVTQSAASQPPHSVASRGPKSRLAG